MVPLGSLGEGATLLILTGLDVGAILAIYAVRNPDKLKHLPSF